MTGLRFLINCTTAASWGILGVLKIAPHAGQSEQAILVGIAEISMAIAIVSGIKPALVHATALCAMAIFGFYHLWASLTASTFAACQCAGKIEMSHGAMAIVVLFLAISHYCGISVAHKENAVAL